MQRFSTLSILTASAALALPAAAVPVTNGSFEAGGTFYDQDPTSEPRSNGSLPGFVYEIPARDAGFGFGFVGIGNDQDTPDDGGTNFLYAAAGASVSSAAADRVAATAGTAYQLDFFGRNDSSNDEGFTASLEFFDSSGTELDAASASFLAGVAGGRPDPFLPLSVTGIAPAGTASVGVEFVVAADGGAVFDQVAISVVPEPASMAAVGLLALAGLRRRR